MLGFVLGAFAYGLAKGQVFARGTVDGPAALGELGADALTEEIEARALVGDLIAQKALGLTPGTALLASSALFGLSHWDAMSGTPSAGARFARVAETTLGGIVYGLAYQRHGLLGATLTHLAHNLGVHTGAKR